MSSNRSSDNSSPIMNSSIITPSSATGPIDEASVMVTAESQGMSRAKAPSPEGPTAMPTAMKPRIGLTRRRWNSGTTTPAALRMIRTSLKSDGWTGLAMPRN